MPRNPVEQPATYQARKDSAKYLNYTAGCINYYVGHLFDKPLSIRAIGDDGATVKPDPFYTGFKEDADGKGTDFHDVLRAAFTDALSLGRAFIKVQKPDADAEPQTRAEWETLGLGNLTVVRLATQSVTDWGEDSTGALTWCLTHETSCDRDSSGQRITVERWTFYDETEIRIYELSYSDRERPHARTIVPLTWRGDHGFSSVPVVRLQLPEGTHLGNTLYDPQVNHFTLLSALRWSLNRTAYPIPIFKVGDPEAYKNTELNAAKGHSLIMGSNDTFEWSNPAADALEWLAKAAKDAKDELYRTANLVHLSMTNNTYNVGRSGMSKIVDRDTAHITLKAYGTLIKEAAQKIYALLSDGREETLRWSIEGIEKFDDDPADLLEAATKFSELGIDSRTARAEIAKRVVLALLPDISEETQELIKGELDSADDALGANQATPVADSDESVAQQ